MKNFQKQFIKVIATVSLSGLTWFTLGPNFSLQTQKLVFDNHVAFTGATVSLYSFAALLLLTFIYVDSQQRFHSYAPLIAFIVGQAVLVIAFVPLNCFNFVPSFAIDTMGRYVCWTFLTTFELFSILTFVGVQRFFAYSSRLVSVVVVLNIVLFISVSVVAVNSIEWAPSVLFIAISLLFLSFHTVMGSSDYRNDLWFITVFGLLYLALSAVLHFHYVNNDLMKRVLVFVVSFIVVMIVASWFAARTNAIRMFGSPVLQNVCYGLQLDLALRLGMLLMMVWFGIEYSYGLIEMPVWSAETQAEYDRAVAPYKAVMNKSLDNGSTNAKVNVSDLDKKSGSVKSSKKSDDNYWSDVAQIAFATLAIAAFLKMTYEWWQLLFGNNGRDGSAGGNLPDYSKPVTGNVLTSDETSQSVGEPVLVYKKGKVVAAFPVEEAMAMNKKHSENVKTQTSVPKPVAGTSSITNYMQAEVQYQHACYQDVVTAAKDMEESAQILGNMCYGFNAKTQQSLPPLGATIKSAKELQQVSFEQYRANPSLYDGKFSALKSCFKSAWVSSQEHLKETVAQQGFQAGFATVSEVDVAANMSTQLASMKNQPAILQTVTEAANSISAVSHQQYIVIFGTQPWIDGKYFDVVALSSYAQQQVKMYASSGRKS